MRFSLLPIILSSLLILVGCSDPKNQKIEELDKMTTSQKEALTRSFTEEDKKLLAGYMIRTALKQAFSGEKDKGLSFGNTTIAQAIVEQRQWIADTDKREAAAKANEAAKNKAEAELKKKAEDARKQLADKMSNVVGLTVLSKEAKEGQFGQRYIQLSIPMENKTERDILGIKYVIRVNDIFGDRIKNLHISYDEGLTAKQLKTDKAGFEISQFSNDDMKLFTMDLDKLKLEFEIQTIIFKDGEKLEGKGE